MSSSADRTQCTKAIFFIFFRWPASSAIDALLSDCFERKEEEEEGCPVEEPSISNNP